MLKANKFAKIMLCICIAFSMIISVNAEIVDISYRNIILNKSDIPNNYININDYNLIISKGYNITNYSYNVSETSDNEPIININTKNNKKFILIIRALYIDEKIPNNINGSTINIDQFKSTQTGFIINYYTVLECTPNNNNVQFTLNNITASGPDNATISSFIFVNTISEIDILNNNINNTTIGIFNIVNSIFIFVTDKPWIILFGVSVSLISFLIYKAKSII